MSSQTLTKENLSETFAREKLGEQHGDVSSVDYNSDDHDGSCTSASTLLDAPSVPGRMSPVPSEDPTMKPLNAEYSGGSNYKNTTIQANVANVQIGYMKENHSPMGNGGTSDQVTYKHPVMENADQERSARNGRRNPRQMKFKMCEKKCISCEARVAENDHLNLKYTKAKEKKRALKQRCKIVEKQLDEKQKECEELQKHLNASHQRNIEFIGYRDYQYNIIHVHNQQIATMQSKTNSLEKEKACVEKQFAELQQQLQTMKENYHRARDEKNAYVEKIMLQEGTIAEQGQKFRNMEENNRREQVIERNAFVKKINDLDEEKNSFEEEITELELRCVDYEDSKKQMMADIITLAHYENFQLESRLRLEKVHERLKTQLDTALAEREATRTQTNILQIYNEWLQRLVNQLLTRVQSFEGRQQDAQALSDELRRTIEGLRFPQQLRQPDNHENLPLPHGPVDIFALYVEVVPEADVLVPD